MDSLLFQYKTLRTFQLKIHEASSLGGELVLREVFSLSKRVLGLQCTETCCKPWKSRTVIVLWKNWNSLCSPPLIQVGEGADERTCTLCLGTGKVWTVSYYIIFLVCIWFAPLINCGTQPTNFHIKSRPWAVSYLLDKYEPSSAGQLTTFPR